jgi:hypothetical protein
VNREDITVSATRSGKFDPLQQAGPVQEQVPVSAVLLPVQYPSIKLNMIFLLKFQTPAFQ